MRGCGLEPDLSGKLRLRGRALQFHFCARDLGLVETERALWNQYFRARDSFTCASLGPAFGLCAPRASGHFYHPAWAVEPACGEPVWGRCGRKHPWFPVWTGQPAVQWDGDPRVRCACCSARIQGRGTCLRGRNRRLDSTRCWPSGPTSSTSHEREQGITAQAANGSTARRWKARAHRAG